VWRRALSPRGTLWACMACWEYAVAPRLLWSCAAHLPPRHQRHLGRRQEAKGTAGKGRPSATAGTGLQHAARTGDTAAQPAALRGAEGAGRRRRAAHGSATLLPCQS
jgi:hypothetical protein